VSRKLRNRNQNEVDEEITGVDSRDKVKHNERSDQLFLDRTMWRVRKRTRRRLAYLQKVESLQKWKIPDKHPSEVASTCQQHIPPVILNFYL